MAAMIGGVSIVAALLMKDPPSGCEAHGLGSKDRERSRGRRNTASPSAESLKTGQMWVLIASPSSLVSGAGLAG